MWTVYRAATWSSCGGCPTAAGSARWCEHALPSKTRSPGLPCARGLPRQQGARAARRRRSIREALSRRWEESFDEVAGDLLDPELLVETKLRTRDLLTGREALFESRIAPGRTRRPAGRRHLRPRRRPPPAELPRVRRPGCAGWTSPTWRWTSSGSAHRTWGATAGPVRRTHRGPGTRGAVCAPPRVPGVRPGEGGLPAARTGRCLRCCPSSRVRRPGGIYARNTQHAPTRSCYGVRRS